MTMSSSWLRSRVISSGHSHPETDEAFIVLEGSLVIEFRDDRIELEKGERCVVPRGIEHKPSAERECHLLVIEPTGTVNTGDVESDKTVDEVSQRIPDRGIK